MTKRLGGVAVRLMKLADGEAAPKWQMLFPLGATKHHPSGKLEFTRDYLGSMAANFKKLADRYLGEDAFGLQVNYHHLGGTDVNAGAPLESTLAAGWIQDVQLRDDGLYCLFSWTPRAKAFIASDEFRYLSPEFAPEYADRDTGKAQGPTLLGAALTNFPFLKDLPRVAASDASPEAAPAAQEGASRMDRKLLTASLGLAETAKDEEITGRIEALKLSESNGTLKLSEAQNHTAKLADDNRILSERVAKFEASEKETRAEAFVSKLVSEGKVVPAMREGVKALALSNLALAETTFANATPVVKFTEQGVAGPDTSDATATVKAAEAKLEARIADLRKAEPTLKYSEARLGVLAREPQLYAELYPAPSK
jgi:phage I-like protein